MDELRELRARIAALKAGIKPVAAKQIKQPDRQDFGIDTVVSRKNKAYSQMNRLHATLRHIGDEEGRRLAALEVLRLEREVQNCWRVIDHHTATGQLLDVDKANDPEEPPFDPSEYSISELNRQVSVAKAYISKAKKEGYPAEKIEERKQFIQTINDYLNELQKPRDSKRGS